MNRYQVKDYSTFIESLNTFLAMNHFEEIIIVADHFMREIIKDETNNFLIKKLNPKIFDYEQDIIFQL